MFNKQIELISKRIVENIDTYVKDLRNQGCDLKTINDAFELVKDELSKERMCYMVLMGGNHDMSDINPLIQETINTINEWQSLNKNSNNSSI